MFGQTEPRLSRYAPHAAMAAHDHDDASLNIVVDGNFKERIGRGERAYARGHISFCPAGITHSQLFGAAGARQIIFRPQEDWLAYLADCKLNLADSPYVGSAAFGHLGDRLTQEIRNDDEFSVIAREGIMLEIIAAFGRSGTAATSSAHPPAWLRLARDFMHENAFAPLSMARIAEAAGRHEIHLAREFRRYFDLPVGAYLRRLRTERAAELLQQSRRDITDIALACGFSSHSHLCREFKARYGVTPSQYRSSRVS
jgi:AraC family transcriptional regulator